MIDIRHDPYGVWKKRGIWEAAKKAGAIPKTYYDKNTKTTHQGLEYPIIHFITGETVATRWKNENSKTACKYLWFSGDKPAANPAAGWYITYPERRREAIAQNNGVVDIVNGEPALWTLDEVGIFHAIATTHGEKTVPPNLVEVCRSMGISRIRFRADKDEAGVKAAEIWRNATSGTGIDFEAVSWSDDLPEKADANDLWMYVNFDKVAFQQIFDNPHVLELPPLPERQTSNFDSNDFSETPQGLLDAILVAAEQRGYRSRGNAEWINGPCLFPENHKHEDKNHSAGINKNSCVLNCFNPDCGEHSKTEVAERLGIDWKRFYPKRRNPKRSKNMQLRDDSPIGEYPMSQWARPVKLPSFSADVQVHHRYISEIALAHYLHRTLLIKSGLGTGKTTLFKLLLTHYEKVHGKPARVLVITHGQALTDDIANRLNIHSYRDIPIDQPELAKSMDQAVSSYDSLYLFDGCLFDIVVIDEAEGFLPHTASGTMSGAEAQRNYETLKWLVRSAGQVVAADAHLSDLSRSWFQSIRGDATAVENTYRHQWGKLVFTKDMAQTIGKAIEKALENVGPVVIPTNSRILSELLRIIFTEILGEGVRVINGWNSANKDSQAFIRNINEQLADTRVFIASPSIGNGTDVQTPVAGVYGVFTRNLWGSSGTILQQMMRYRNASERYLYITPTFEGTEETDWKAIYSRQMKRLEGTAAVADFDLHAISTSNDTQQAILKLTAMFQAQWAEQRNNIFSFTVAYAKDEGFDIVYDETENKGIQERLKQAREKLSEEQEKKVLTLEPISPEEFDDIRQKGLVTRDDNYALLRYKIEYTSGQGITPELYHLLQTSQNRADFNRFCDLFEPLSTLQEKDRAQADAGELIIRRRHYTRNMQLITQSLETVFGKDWLHNQQPLTEQEIEERYQPYLDDHFGEIEMYLDTRKGLSPAALNVLRRVVKRGGMKLASKQVMVNGERFYVYWLDDEFLERMRELASTALAARRQREADQKSLLNSVSVRTQYTDLSNRTTKNTPIDADVGVIVTLSTGEQIAVPF